MRSKTKPFAHLLFLAAFAFLMQGCLKDSITRTYTLLIPVYEQKSTVLSSIKSGAPTTIQSPGKMYMLGKYIYLNEVNKGVHIIDNGDVLSPKSIGFIPIPGNIDIAVKGTVLYADLYTDMLVIDIADPAQINVLRIVPNVFPERQYQNGFSADSSRYIVDWIRKDTTVDDRDVSIWRECRGCFMLANDAATKSGSFVPGIAGSMSRFSIVNDYLYTVNLYELGVMDIRDAANPSGLGKSFIGMNIETVFPFKNHLFIGSSGGMFIYNISNAASPQRMGSFEHANACDPVVADDDHAFVTLRSGNTCMGVANQLDVIDVKNLMAPRLLKTYPLSNPHGLAKHGNLLFICDGADGLKTYDVSDVQNIKLLQHLKGLDAYDVIAWNGRLIVVAKEGLFQFDYTNPSSLKLLSTLAISRK